MSECLLEIVEARPSLVGQSRHGTPKIVGPDPWNACLLAAIA
jgi:hypothetical protein